MRKIGSFGQRLMMLIRLKKMKICLPERAALKNLPDQAFDRASSAAHLMRFRVGQSGTLFQPFNNLETD